MRPLHAWTASSMAFCLLLDPRKVKGRRARGKHQTPKFAEVETLSLRHVRRGEGGKRLQRTTTGPQRKAAAGPAASAQMQHSSSGSLVLRCRRGRNYLPRSALGSGGTCGRINVSQFVTYHPCKTWVPQARGTHRATKGGCLWKMGAKTPPGEKTPLTEAHGAPHASNQSDAAMPAVEPITWSKRYNVVLQVRNR